MSNSALYVQIFAILSCACMSMATIEAMVRGAESATGFILRNKRNPSRGMSISGFMPGGAMSAFASSADLHPYYRYKRPAWSPVSAPEDNKNFHPAAEGESPDTNLQPPQEAAGDEKRWNTEQGQEENPVQEVPSSENSPDEPKKSKKKYNRPRDEREEDEDEYERPGQGGNAAASFNAWFPIMLGMFPPTYQQPGLSDGATGYSGYGNSRGRNPSGYTTVVANSVSHGRNGVASSHAVAYGGGSSPQQNPQNK